MVAPKRILVVDDEPTIRESCQRIFRQRGYEVETAATGREGLERARQGYFDCALIDLKMPDMHGMDIVRDTRESRGNMALLIVTGYGDLETAAEAVKLGVCDYICKPFSPDEIVNAVEGALARPQGLATDGLRRLAKEVADSVPKPDTVDHRSPQGVAEMVTKSVSVSKATASAINVIVLGVLAGVYIGFGAALATLVSHDAAAHVGFGLSKVLTGAVFSVGLMLVIIAGAELFTGNNLMVAGVLGKECGWGRMLSRWGLVYLANFAGSVLLAYLVFRSGIWKMAGGAVGAKAVAIANGKVALPFDEAFFRAVGCNWLVCLAVWMALSARDIAGKILAIFFPIMAFVALGFEHCVANMYFVPMGLFLKATPAAGNLGIAQLTWGDFFARNLFPVTLGNIVGGAIFVGTVYWFVYMRKLRRREAMQA